MTFVPPVRYSSQEQFDAFVDQILLFNKNDPHHCHMVIDQTLNSPVFSLYSKEKPHWFFRILALIYKPQNERADHINAFARNVFRLNQDYANKNIVRSAEAIAKLASVFAPYADQYNDVLNDLFQPTQALQALQNQRLRAEQQKAVRMSETRRTAQSKVNDVQKECEQETGRFIATVKESLKIVAERHKALKDTVQAARAKLIHFFEYDSKFHDTLILAKDGKKITTNIEFISDPTFFVHIEANCKKAFITDEDKKSNPQVTKGYDLSKYSEETIHAFLHYLKQGLIDPSKHYNYIELYHLAKDLHIDSLQTRCLEILYSEKKIDLDKALELLSEEANYPAREPLILIAYDIIVTQLQSAIVKDNFKKIKLEHMLEIAKDDGLALKDEYQLYNIIKTWSGKSRTDLKKLLKQSGLADCLRVQHFTKAQFIALMEEQPSLPKKIVRKWGSHFLTMKDSLPKIIIDNQYNRAILRIQAKPDRSTHIFWNFDASHYPNGIPSLSINLLGRKLNLKIKKDPYWNSYVNASIEVETEIRNIRLYSREDAKRTFLDLYQYGNFAAILPKTSQEKQQPVFSVELEIPPT